MRLDVRVREALAAAHVDGDRLILQGRLDRTVYSHVNRALENAGGKWSRKSGAHVFPGGAAAAIAPLLETGSVPDAKADHGAFYTPPALAAEVIIRAGIRPGAEVLEPSAGDGASPGPPRPPADRSPASRFGLRPAQRFGAAGWRCSRRTSWSSGARALASSTRW